MERELTTEQLRLIEMSFSGVLNEADQALFDQYLKEDPLFLTEFEFQTELKKALVHQNKSEFKELLVQIESTYSKRSGSFRPWWTATAAAILLISVTSVVYLFSPSSKNVDLVSVYFQPQTNIHYPITRSFQNSSLRDKAFIAYEAGEWEKASVLIDSLARTEPSLPLNLYRANLLLLEGRFEQAIPLLEDFVESNDPYADRALWYLALAYLGLKNTEKSSEYVEMVIQGKHFPYEKAIELRDRLASF